MDNKEQNKASSFWHQNTLKWETKCYEIINFAKLVKDKNNINSDYYQDLIVKILQSNFKNIITVADILKEHNIKVTSKINKEDIIHALSRLSGKELTINFITDNFFVAVDDIIDLINQNSFDDLLNGNLIIIYKPYYENICIQKPVVKKNKIKELKRIKYLIFAVGIFIAVILVVLTIYSGSITSMFEKLGNLINKLTGNTINSNYSIILVKFIEFILEIIVIYIFYLLLIFVLKIIFNGTKKSELKKELAIINKKNIDLIERLLQYKDISEKIIKKTNSALKGIKIFLRTILFIFIFALLLGLFNINLTSILATTTILTVVLTVGAQSTLGDYFAGVLFAFDDYSNVGDLVKINDIQGRIISANLRRICIETTDKELHYILHSQIKHVINYSKGYNKAKVVFDIAYESNPKEVIKLLKNHLLKNWKKNKNIKEEPEVVAITNFNASGIGFIVYAECERETRWEVERWLRLEIFELFQNNKIEIPYQKITIINQEN